VNLKAENARGQRNPATSTISREEPTVKKLGYLIPVALAVAAMALPLGAQDGCVDSPENPTAVLGLLVSAASIGLVQIRNRIRARRDSKDK
jgi:XrtJ-associated TM-motif-TM protein